MVDRGLMLNKRVSTRPITASIHGHLCPTPQTIGRSSKWYRGENEYILYDAKELDQGRGTDYWITTPEMTARAFQGYIEDKISQK